MREISLNPFFWAIICLFGIFVDGCVLLNYPIHIFDAEKFCFYLYATPNLNPENKPKTNFKDFITHLYECYNISLQLSEVDNNQIDKQRTVVINTLDVKETEFNLNSSDLKYLNLIKEGYEATAQYLRDFRHPSIKFNW